MTYAYDDDTMPGIAKLILSGGESVAGVCAELGIGRTAYYEWIKNHPKFAKAVEQGKEAAQRHWEDIGKKGITGQIEKFSGTPWMFVMKNRFKDDYADNKPQSDGMTLIEQLLHAAVDKKNVE